MQNYSSLAVFKPNDEEKPLIDKINKLKKKRKAVILAHNYQIPGIQEIADFTGDSLELSLKASQTDAEMIVFCGVHFMAESAAIFSPEKKVLIPDLNAGCSLAASIDRKTLIKWKKLYPDAVVVAYINTTAEVKAESDICCTSTNAVEIVNSIPKDRRILFLPDMFLASYTAKMTGREIIVYPGECHVHARVTAENIMDKMREYPDAELLLHPECGCVSSCMHFLADGKLPQDKTKILSTGGMMRYVKKTGSEEFIVATESGVLYPLQKQNPKKKFYPLREDMVCEYMKMITLPKVFESLRDLKFEVKVPEETARRARVPIEAMMKIRG